ncbi:hypothetical protein HDV04_002303 [Boothiomyces sp. JEL0838]|nr:hypothetical protein HDV04_002496 [Boothiomyces sp. JEL0838]KAJ3313142.1 hypothetical protein HDV04_002303 [Boothiomyces sp. JEL0838]
MQKSRKERLEEYQQNKKQTKILKQKNSNTIAKKDELKSVKKEIRKPTKPLPEVKILSAVEPTQRKQVEKKPALQAVVEQVENRVKDSTELHTQESTQTLELSDNDQPPVEDKNDSFSDNKDHETVNHNIVVQLELESKTNQIEQLSTLNKRLKEQLEENESQKNNIIYEMERTINKLTSEIDELEKKPEQHAEKWILLTKVEQLEEIIAEKDLEIKRLSSASVSPADITPVQELQQLINEQKQEIVELKSNQSYLQSKINEYQQILNQKDSVIQMQKSQLNEIKANLEQTQSEYFMLQNTSKKEYDQDYNNLKKDHSELMNEHKLIKTDLESSIECIELLEKEVTELHMKLTETETAHEINSNMYKQNINELEQALKEALDENKNLYTTNSQVEKEKQELVSVLDELEKIQSQFENNDEKISELEQENLSIYAANSKLQIDIEEYRVALEETIQENKELHMELTVLKTPNKECKEMECQTESNRTEYKEALTKLVLAGDLQTQKYNQTIKQYESKINSLKKEKNLMQGIVDKQKTLEAQLLEALEKASEQNKELKNQLNKQS